MPWTMSYILSPLRWLYAEFGLASVYASGLDTWLVILARCFRMFAYGANSLIIALFFSALHFTDFQIGLFMTLTLVGDVLLSLFLTLIADRFGRRRILLGGACLMVVSGAVFAISENFWILLAAAVVGVLSATGGDFGPFRTIEESTLSHLTGPKTRTDVMSWYVTGSSFGSALGVEFSGRAVDWLKEREGWTIIGAYHAVFWLYIIMGAIMVAFTLCMSEKCEIKEAKIEKLEEDGEAGDRLLDERQGDGEGLQQNMSSAAVEGAIGKERETSLRKSWITQISSETRTVMYKLWFLLTVDSLADGMTSYALTNYYLDRKFHMSKSTLGDIVSISYFLASSSTIFAGPLARRLGLVNTMVFTHIPSSMAVLFFAAPQGLAFTVTLFFIRTGLNNMDQAPRVALIAAIVKPEERTAVMGITTTLRTLAGALGPTVTGWLAGSDRFWIAFVAAGALRLAYDLGLWAIFVNIKLYTHEATNDGVESDPRHESDEEELAELAPRASWESETISSTTSDPEKEGKSEMRS